MSDDKYKKAAENLLNNVKPATPQQGEYRQDSQIVPIIKIHDGKVIENSVKVPAKPPLERKSFGLMAAQSMLDEINNKKG
jgi:hypothetical protein